MEEYLEKIKDIVLKLKKLEEEENKFKVEYPKIDGEQKKLEASYIKTTNMLQKNDIILEELNNTLTILRDTKDKINGYGEFKKKEKKKRITLTAFVIAIFGVLLLPLTFTNIIAYLQCMLLGTALIGLSNSVKYFNDIRLRKELLKSNDIDKIANEISKREKQKEIAECVSIKLDVKRTALTNEIDNLNKEKKYIFDRLEYVDDCKKSLIEELLKEVEQNLVNSSEQLNKDELSETGSCLKLGRE
jgi:hypothetical protein